MHISFRLNREDVTFEVTPNQTLLSLLRANGVFGVKHGCETGECGACAVLTNGLPITMHAIDVHS